MTGLDDDRELDDFLARRSMLHRRLADRDRADPPPELDRLVLDRAREAIQTPTNLPVHRAPRWAVPVGLAASLVIAFTVVVHMGHMGPGGARVASSASPAADAAAARLAETGEREADRSASSSGVSANQLRIQMEKRAAPPAAPPVVALNAKPAGSTFAEDSRAANEPPTAAFAANDPLAPNAAAAATGPSADATAVESAASARNSEPALAQSQAAAPARAPETAAAQLADSAASPASALASSRVAPSAASSTLGTGDTKSGDSAASAAPALANARVGASAVVMPHAVAKASGAAEAPQSLIANNATQNGAAGAATASAPRSGYAPAPSQHRAIVPAKSEMTASPAPTERAEAKRANPQVWLREIEALRTAGKTAEADRELAEFRKAFPNEPTSLPPTRDSRPVQ
jgi:hypothetical protein